MPPWRAQVSKYRPRGCARPGRVSPNSAIAPPTSPLPSARSANTCCAPPAPASKRARALDGRPRAPLSEATRRTKPKNVDNPLTLKGQPFGALDYEIDRDGLLFGNPEIYAGPHRFGGAAQPGRGLPFGGAAISARPLLGLF